MRFCSIVASAASVLGIASAQQYAGDTISGYLPTIPGAEVAFFRIEDNTGKNDNLTLINYYGLSTSNTRINEANIQRAVITVHGLLRDPWNYINDTMNALAVATSTDANINKDSVAVMAPYFPSGDDKGYAYPWTDGLKANKGSTTNALVWSGAGWISGDDNQYPHTSTNSSSFYVLDQIIQYYDNQTLFPNLKQIVLVGHSAGGQLLQRYAAVGPDLNTHVPVTYWIGNPNSYAWFTEDRPLAITDCSDYDEFREGFAAYASGMTYGVDLVAQGRDAVLANYQTKQIAYARAMLDHGDVSGDCRPNTTGADRHERFFFYIDAFRPSCDDPASATCDTVDLIQVTHDNGQMFKSDAGVARLFKDNFYGDNTRAYDFGYPRAQAGDDPYPDPSLVNTLPVRDYNVYAGNMTYQGCWTNQEPITPAALPKLLYDNAGNSREGCTSGCYKAGFRVAGVQNQTQCFCGNSLNSQSAVLVVDSSCRLACPGNSAEICGSVNRLSLFSAAYPTFD